MANLESDLGDLYTMNSTERDNNLEYFPRPKSPCQLLGIDPDREVLWHIFVMVRDIFEHPDRYDEMYSQVR